MELDSRIVEVILPLIGCKLTDLACRNRRKQIVGHGIYRLEAVIRRDLHVIKRSSKREEVAADSKATAVIAKGVVVSVGGIHYSVCTQSFDAVDNGKRLTYSANIHPDIIESVEIMKSAAKLFGCVSHSAVSKLDARFWVFFAKLTYLSAASGMAEKILIVRKMYNHVQPVVVGKLPHPLGRVSDDIRLKCVLGEGIATVRLQRGELGIFADKAVRILGGSLGAYNKTGIKPLVLLGKCTSKVTVSVKVFLGFEHLRISHQKSARDLVFAEIPIGAGTPGVKKLTVGNLVSLAVLYLAARKMKMRIENLRRHMGSAAFDDAFLILEIVIVRTDDQIMRIHNIYLSQNNHVSN